MLNFSIENARGEREEEPRLRGGLRTDAFMVGSLSRIFIFRGRRSIW